MIDGFETSDTSDVPEATLIFWIFLLKASVHSTSSAQRSMAEHS
jgi:hypothetical protein